MTPRNQEEQNIVDSSIPPPPGTQSHPWLLILDTKKREKQVFYSISEGRYYTKRIPEMRNKRIFPYNNEWLVTVDCGNRESYLLNVISMEKIDLPKFTLLNSCYMCCYLTSSPKDPDCLVVFIVGLDPSNLSLCRPGDDNFVKKKILFSGEDKKLKCTSFFNGTIYGVGDSTFSLLRANLNDPALEFQSVFRGGSVQNSLLGDHPHCYLIESCGELLLVMRYSLHYDVCDFQVFQADFSSLEWEELTSIGDRSIFLEELSTQGYSCSASKSGSQENCIYYTEMENRILYIFNLEDGTFTSTIPCPTFDRKKVTQQWVMIPPTSNMIA